MKILVLQHVASEHPGSFREVMRARGASMVQIELDEGETIPPDHGCDALLVMGGPMDVWQEDAFAWLAAEKTFIRDWVAGGRPYLGMCLGAQLLAEACGGRVGLMAEPEVGMSEVRLRPDPLFEGVPALCTCFQWHGAEVKNLPPGAVLLSTSPQCAVQAFRVGRAAYGLQFHMELTATTAEEWGALPQYAAALERVRGPGALPALQADVARHFAPLQNAAEKIFGNFLDIALTALAETAA